MNETLKKFCPVVAIVSFVLCVTGAIGVINADSEQQVWQMSGVFFLGVSLFVLFAMLGIWSLSCNCGSETAGRKYSAKNRQSGKTNKPVQTNKQENAKTQQNASQDDKELSNGLKRDNGKQLPENSGPTTLYVCNLTEQTKEDDLREEFGVFGAVKSVKLISDKDGSLKGYAFVEMENKAEAELAMEDINGQEIKGQQVRVSYARRKGSYNKRRKT